MFKPLHGTLWESWLWLWFWLPSGTAHSSLLSSAFQCATRWLRSLKCTTNVTHSHGFKAKGQFPGWQLVCCTAILVHTVDNRDWWRLWKVMMRHQKQEFERSIPHSMVPCSMLKRVLHWLVFAVLFSCAIGTRLTVPEKTTGNMFPKKRPDVCLSFWGTWVC